MKLLRTKRLQEGGGERERRKGNWGRREKGKTNSLTSKEKFGRNLRGNGAQRRKRK